MGLRVAAARKKSKKGTGESPLSGPPPEEVPLANPPLVRVLAQVRFPLIASVEQRDFIAPFQEAVRKQYPVLRQEQRHELTFGPDGPAQARPSTVWRFKDAEDVWRVSLAPTFVALETSRYQSRDDFMVKLMTVLTALDEHIEPAVVDRLGLRYIDHVHGAAMDKLKELVRREIAGVLSTPLREHIRQSICENRFELPNEHGVIAARWGLLPPNGTVDPSLVEPVADESWLLDLDAYVENLGDWDNELLLERAREFAERVYSVFRWAVTDEFLREYGGEP